MRQVVLSLVIAIVGGCIGAVLGRSVPVVAQSGLKLRPAQYVCTDKKGKLTTACSHLVMSDVTFVGQTTMSDNTTYPDPKGHGYWIEQVAGDNAIAWWYNDGVHPNNVEKFSWHSDGGFYSGYLWLPQIPGSSPKAPDTVCINGQRQMLGC